MTSPEYFRASSRASPGENDVAQLEGQTRALRAVDYQCGGGMCRDAVLVRIHRGHEMLGQAADAVRHRLFSAVSDLHNLAGWTCFDSGHVGAAHHHLDLALELAAEGGNEDLAANIHYRRGRIHLHHGAADEALAQFQLGQLAAQRSGSRLAVSILCANQAWAYARKGEVELALGLLGRAQEEFAAADVVEAPDWARFFTATDVAAMVGTVHIELALTVGVPHTAAAVPALVEAVARYGPEMARSRSFCLAMLATGHLLDGDIEHGAEIGSQAIITAETLKSVRTKDRLRPLKREADKRRDNPAARALAADIAAFVAHPTHT
ncbi:MAG TPA: transcriptional regulator [Amycolatopsis sp.]|nr:transcriptional regulator [Amycolatopsis sp.]